MSVGEFSVRSDWLQRVASEGFLSTWLPVINLWKEIIHNVSSSVHLYAAAFREKSNNELSLMIAFTL